jgi:hypothetical protein
MSISVLDGILSNEQSTTDYVPDRINQLHDTCHYEHQHWKVASDGIKEIMSGCTAQPKRGKL